MYFLWERDGTEHSNHCKFFFSDLIDEVNYENLLFQAYILVSKTRFSYSDVKQMTKLERALFIKFYTEELKAQEDAYKQYNSK